MKKLGTLKSQDVLLARLLATVIRDCSAILPSYLERECLRDISTVKRRFRKEGTSFLTKTLPSYGKHLDRSIEVGQWLPMSAFKKRSRSGPLPSFLWGLVSLVFATDGRLLNTPCPLAVKAIRQVTLLAYKLELPFSQKCVEEVLEKFVSVDASLPEVREESVHTREVGAVLRRARVLCTLVFGSFDPKGIFPRHGPGAVATRERYGGKWLFSRLYRGIHAFYPYYDYFYGSRKHFVDAGRVKWFGLDKLDRGVARVVLVPKDSRGPRIISMEPLEYQFIQQGLMRKLYAHLETHPLTRGRVNFTDQKVNASLAMSSSVDRKWSTLDMSEASDRVSLALVKQVFGGTQLLTALLAARSHDTELPDGRVVSLRKFAPMGSALCFPVESFIFYALCVAALTYRGYSLRKACGSVYVYGDDLVVATECVDVISTALPLFSLKLNETKCFSRSHFRESCGVDAFYGVNVTPVRLRSAFSISPQRGELLLRQVSLGNLLYKGGYWGASEFVREVTETTYGSLPSIPEGWTCSYPAWEDCTLSSPVFPGKQTRWNPDYQRVEYKVLTTRVKTQHSRLAGWERVMRNLLVGPDNAVPQFGETGFSPSPRKETIVRVQKRYVPA